MKAEVSDFLQKAGLVHKIEATQKAAGNVCPACGYKGGGYLRGDKAMTVFCNRCGCVYEVEAEAIG